VRFERSWSASRPAKAVWTVFTNDREGLDRVLADGLFEPPPTVQASSMPSLTQRLDPDKGRRTYSIERGAN
jgi:hypothetical protein